MAQHLRLQQYAFHVLCVSKPLSYTSSLLSAALGDYALDFVIVDDEKSDADQIISSIRNSDRRWHLNSSFRRRVYTSDEPRKKHPLSSLSFRKAYVKHIVDHYHNLARHTVFIRALSIYLQSQG